jgi:hypothetical protein
LASSLGVRIRSSTCRTSPYPSSGQSAAWHRVARVLCQQQHGATALASHPWSWPAFVPIAPLAAQQTTDRP